MAIFQLKNKKTKEFLPSRSGEAWQFLWFPVLGLSSQERWSLAAMNSKLAALQFEQSYRVLFLILTLLRTNQG